MYYMEKSFNQICVIISVMFLCFICICKMTNQTKRILAFYLHECINTMSKTLHIAAYTYSILDFIMDLAFTINFGL